MFLRVVRLLKTAKMLRVVRMMKLFKELRLMMGAILGSMKSMFWACIMILIITYIFGILFLQAGTSYRIEEAGRILKSVDDDLMHYWSSVVQSMLSLYWASTGGDSWSYIARPLKEVGWPYYVFFLVYIAFFMFVVINTLT